MPVIDKGRQIIAASFQSQIFPPHTWNPTLTMFENCLQLCTKGALPYAIISCGFIFRIFLLIFHPFFHAVRPSAVTADNDTFTVDQDFRRIWTANQKSLSKYLSNRMVYAFQSFFLKSLISYCSSSTLNASIKIPKYTKYSIFYKPIFRLWKLKY